MGSKHTIEVAILAETKKATSALKKFAGESGLEKLGGVIKTAAIGIAAGVGTLAVGAGIIIADGIKDAKGLEQSVGAVDTVFKGSAAQMHEWAKGAGQALGLTQNSYNELATVLGTQLKNGGTAIDEIGGKTNELMGLGADLASMFGGSTADAVGALSSALKGERDPIERYGVSLKQATIDAKAAEMGFTKVGGSLTDEAQQAATLALIMEQTADAHGNFAKEADTVEGKQARLTARWTNMTTNLGSKFLPIIGKLADVLATYVMPAVEQVASAFGDWASGALDRLSAWFTSTGAPAIQRFGSWLKSDLLPQLTNWAAIISGELWPRLQSLGKWLMDARGWLLPIAAFIAGIAGAIRVWTIAQSAWTLATTLASAAQRILNLVLAANPIGIIITVVAGLVAGIIALYNSNEDARRIIDAAWAAIKGAIDAVVGWVVNSAVPWLQDAWAAVAGFAQQLYDAHVAAFNSVKDAITGFVQAVKDFVQRVIDAHVEMGRQVGLAADAFVRWWQQLPGRIWTFAKDIATKAAQAATDAGRALGNRIAGAAAGFAAWWQQLPGKVWSWASGMASRAGQLATDAGRALGNRIAGAAAGFASWFQQLPSRIVSWASGMFSQGSQIAGDVGRGLISGIGAFAGRIRDKFSSVISGAIDSAKRLLGIASPSRVFRTIGQQTGQGLEIGLDSWETRVARAAARLADTTISAGTPDRLTLPAPLAATASTPPPITINLYALDPTPDLGRRLAQALRPYLARGGAL